MPNWITTYAAIHRPSARSVARSAALSTLAAIGESTGRTTQALGTPRVHFIYFHHIFKDEIEPFRRLLASLLKIMTPIGYSEAVERCVRGPIDRPYLAFSFDDGFKNCLDAASVLEEFGARACFFVCPDVIEADEETQVAFARDRLHLPPIEFMSWSDLDSLRARGHEIGNHTVGHPRLSDLADPREPIDRGLAQLRLRYADVKHFAWPYGSFAAFSDKARDAVLASGHASIASGVRGAHRRTTNDSRVLCIKRDHVIAKWPQREIRYLLAKSVSIPEIRF